MARTINANSNRQKAFKYLDGQLDKDRNVVVTAVMKKFTMGKSYAATLYQDHRSQAIDAGKMTKVFVVRDTKDGKAIAPHITSHYVSTPETDASTTAKKAVTAYGKTLKARIALANKLPTTKATA